MIGGKNITQVVANHFRGRTRYTGIMSERQYGVLYMQVSIKKSGEYTQWVKRDWAFLELCGFERTGVILLSVGWLNKLYVLIDSSIKTSYTPAMQAFL